MKKKYHKDTNFESIQKNPVSSVMPEKEDIVTMKDTDNNKGKKRKRLLLFKHILYQFQFFYNNMPIHSGIPSTID